MKIDADLQLMVATTLAYIVENCDLAEDDLSKINTVIDGMKEYICSNEGNDDSPEQVIDELIKNISSIQEKIDAYNDLEYEADWKGELHCKNN